MSQPLISIVTINYNDAKGLEKTIQSISQQTLKDYQYIIIDGGSSDESVNVIKKNRDQIDYYVSEKDNGIYDAMNKGTRIASGKYVLYLNSGDYLADAEILQKMSPFLRTKDIIYGDIYRETNEGRALLRYNTPLNFEYFTRDSLPHQASFISLALLQQFDGPYEVKYKICADWKFFMDAICKKSASTIYVPMKISVFDTTGISSDDKNKQIAIDERNAALNNEYKMFFAETLELVHLRHILRSRPIQYFFKIRKVLKKY